MNTSLRWPGVWARRVHARSTAAHPPRERSSGPLRLRWTLQDDHTHRALQSERARFAASVDLELRLACRGEAAMRRELGCAARALLRRRLLHRLGFVRLADYARERLGVSARTVQFAAWLATRLDELPAVSRAYDRSELSWAQARAICGVASAGDEERWLAIARESTVDALERVAKLARPPRGVPADPDADTNEIDGEPAVRWRMACPARVRALWGRALELASRMAGEPLAAWRAAEVIAAEGSSGRPSGMSLGDRALLAYLRLARRRRRVTAATADGSAPVPTAFGGPSSAIDPDNVLDAAIDSRALGEGSPVSDPLPRVRTPEPDPIEPLTPADPFALDARLVEAMRAIRTSEPRIGRLLRVVVDHRLYPMLGYPALEQYVRERLGISIRKAWALLKVEKATARSDDFGSAYRDGRLSWARALTLLPVLDRNNANAWLARAELVTVRRLCDEVNWVVAARDASGARPSLSPPPLDDPLASPVVTACMEGFRESSAVAAARVDERRESSLAAAQAEERRELALAAGVQIGAHSRSDLRSEVCDAEVTFFGPASVVALLRDVLDAFAPPDAPRWTAFERLLQHVIHYWESTPRHRDPIFARDGWRCTVPACSSRRNLHDHHIRFRSRGGGNLRDNRTVVCAAHHLHGIHAGTVRASGSAPNDIEWQLGVRGGGAPPLLAYRGDRRLSPARDDEAKGHAGLVAHHGEPMRA